MLSRLRIWILAVLVTTGFTTMSCVSVDLPEGADYTHRYYAALADYNQAKRAALAYVQIPETPISHIDAVLTTVNRADQRILQFEALRKVSDVGDVEYSGILIVVNLAADQLRSYVTRKSS